MYPAYGGMSSYSYQRPKMPSPQCYHPSWEAAPPQVKEDPAPAGPSFVYGSWPQNYGYSVPMQCPSCFKHPQYPPAYHNVRPPCANFPSPPPAYGHFCGGYPPYPVSYVPPPHYTTELPRYEYDKNAPTEFHCCGCHNHPCHVKDDKRDQHVKIDEHEPEVETRKGESLLPAGANDLTHPILWIPPGYTMNKERQQQQLPRRVVENEADRQQVSPYYVRKPQWQKWPIETEVEEQKESPRVKKLQWQQRPVGSEAGEHLESPRVKKPQQSVKTAEQEPNVRYGWFPLDMNSIKELLEGRQAKKALEWESKGGDGKNIQAMENKEQNKQFPFPIFWMPYSSQGENDVKGQQEKDAGETHGEEASPTFKIIPMRFEYPDHELEKIKTAVGDDDSGVGRQGTEKTSATIKTIPVKPPEEYVPKQLKKHGEQKDGSKAVKNAEGNGNNGHSSSPKKSKLPPICLRVDPPKKKNGNGRSRSPSPPVKKHQESEESRTGGSKKEIKVAEAEDKSSSQSKIEVSRKAAEQKMEQLEGDVEKKGVEGHQCQETKENKAQEAKEPARKILSEQEAATIVQSAYRGFDVRRWEPLKKLRQIAKVREEAAEVKKRIEDMESRAGSSTDEKEKATVAETIMNLLLKLDTIQGLPPSFRDARRSVAKELITLQEKLDSIINKKSTPVVHEISNADDPSKVSSQDEGSKGVVDTSEEPSNIPSQLEGFKVDEIVEETSNVSGVDECSRDMREGAEESSAVSNETKSTEVEDVSAKACLDDNSRNIDETAAEYSKVSSEIESSEREDKRAKPGTEDDEVPGLNEVSSAQPLTGWEVVGGSDYEKTLEASLVRMESFSEPQNEVDSSPPVPTVGESLTTDKKEESDGSEIVQGEPPAESVDQLASIGTIENATEQVGVLFGHKDKQVNVTAELPEKLEGKEIADVEVDSGAVLREESVERACSAPVSEAPEIDLAPAKIDETTQQTELPQEVTELGVEEQTFEIQSLETLSRDQEDQSADVKDEATIPIEVESCKQESTESISIEAQKVLEAEPVDIDMPILEHDVHRPGEPTGEKAGPSAGGCQGSQVPGPSTEEVEEMKQSPQKGVTLDSTMASNENQVSHDEDAHESVGANQEKMVEKTVSILDQQTVPDHENLKDQSIRSEGEAPKTVTRESKHEGAAKESKEEEHMDKRIIEENEELREMLERLIASEKEQQDLILSLSGKVKDLEKQLARKKKMKSTKRPVVLVSRAPCGNGKPSNGSLRGRPMGAAS